MKAYIKRIKGLSLSAKADSNHWLAMDAAEDVGGSSAGARPLELLLMGLGGCTTMDVLSILQKKRVQLDDYECHLEAERVAEHPRVFTRIKIKYMFYGNDIPKLAVERAIELSETKYCSALEMLRRSAEIVTEYEIKKLQ